MNKMVSGLLDCIRCGNKGYYSVDIAGKTDRIQMFCACEYGKTLQEVSGELRLNDLRVVSRGVNLKLSEIKANLDNLNEATKLIDSLKKELEELEIRAVKAINHV